MRETNDPVCGAAAARPSQVQTALAQRAERYIQEHMDRRVTIAELAAHLGVSQTYLKACFRSVYGTSVFAYVRGQKMHAAARMLSSSGATVLEIAGRCGYDNASKFARAFRETHGMTPSQYRLQRSIR